MTSDKDAGQLSTYAYAVERAGFTREGVRRRLLRHDGPRVDATPFSRLADE